MLHIQKGTWILYSLISSKLTHHHSLIVQKFSLTLLVKARNTPPEKNKVGGASLDASYKANQKTNLLTGVALFGITIFRNGTTIKKTHQLIVCSAKKAVVC